MMIPWFHNHRKGSNIQFINEKEMKGKLKKKKNLIFRFEIKGKCYFNEYDLCHF